MAEVSEPWSAYRHVEPALIAAPTLEAKMRVLVSKFEGSAQQERDIARRSIIDRPDMPPLTNAQKEYIYAQNKRKYAQMKANGTYSEQKG